MDIVVAGTEKVGAEVAVSRIERNVRFKRRLGTESQSDLGVEELSCRGTAPFSISSWLEVVVVVVVVLGLY